MAIATFGPIISAARGKIGGTVFSANKSGPYVKAWSRGSNPASPDQTAHRAVITEFSQAWSDLTDTQKNNWATYSALPAQLLTSPLGEDYAISGFNWYVALNQNLRSSSEGAISDAPVLGTPDTPIIETVTFRNTPSATNSAVKLTAASPDLADFHAVKALVVNSVGRTAQASVRPHMITEVPSVGGRFLIFQDELEARFGTIQSDQKLFVTVRTQNSEGRRGPLASGDAIAP